MKNKLFGMASRFGSKVGDTVSSAATQASALVQEHKPDAQEIEQAKAWVKKTASATAAEASRLGKDMLKSGLAKDAAKGAAVGAVIAVPVPLIGPLIGAVVGAGIGTYANLTRPKIYSQQALPSIAQPQATVIEMVTVPKDMYAELLKLDDLLKRGILTQAEFDAHKTKLLNGG